MAYAKRYAGGFVDKPTLTSPIDATFLNAVETALLALFDTNPASANMVPVWTPAGTHYVPQLITNASIDPAAAIAKSKLAALNIADADVAGGAAISRSKLNFGAGLVDADIAVAAAIQRTKLARSATILFNSANVSVAFNAFQAITFDSEAIDDEGLHSTSANTTRITIVTPGLYLVGGLISWQNAAGGDRNAFISLNSVKGYPALTFNTVGSGFTGSLTFAPMVLAANDIVELIGYHNVTGSTPLNAIGGSVRDTTFWAVRL